VPRAEFLPGSPEGVAIGTPADCPSGILRTRAGGDFPQFFCAQSSTVFGLAFPLAEPERGSTVGWGLEVGRLL